MELECDVLELQQFWKFPKQLFIWIQCKRTCQVKCETRAHGTRRWRGSRRGAIVFTLLKIEGSTTPKYSEEFQIRTIFGFCNRGSQTCFLKNLETATFAYNYGWWCHESDTRRGWRRFNHISHGKQRRHVKNRHFRLRSWSPNLTTSNG